MKSTRQKMNEILGLPQHGVSWTNLSLEGETSAIQSTKQRLDDYLRQQGHSLLGDLRYDDGVGVTYGPKDSVYKGCMVEIATNHELTALVVQYMTPGVQLGFLPLNIEIDALKKALPEFMYARNPPSCSIEGILRKEKAA